ncbi:TNF receptor-associated factor 2-like isoform X2 [Ptychodera flava]
MESTSDDEKHNKELKNAETKITDLESRFNTVLTDTGKVVTRKRRNAQQIIEARAEGRENKRKLVRIVTKLKFRPRIFAMQTAVYADMKIRLDELEKASYDGTMVWPINSFADNREQATGGRQPIVSSSFFTSRYGYKMKAVLYINGDIVGVGEFMSVYLLIMEDEYAAIQDWPFKQKITFQLIDQRGGSHVTKVLEPKAIRDENMEPVTPGKVVGFPLFYSLARFGRRIGDFVVDDTMFIKVIVDNTGLDEIPSSALPL